MTIGISGVKKAHEKPGGHWQLARMKRADPVASGSTLACLWHFLRIQLSLVA